jgi:hypothetical protein
MSASPKNFVMVIPVEGRPFISQSWDDKAEGGLKVLQTIVEGSISPVNPKQVRIHPMFMEANPKWELVQKLLGASSTKMYVNEDGMYKCCPNMATIISAPAGHCPHLMGNIALIVSKKALDFIGADVSALKEEVDDDDDDE